MGKRTHLLAAAMGFIAAVLISHWTEL